MIPEFGQFALILALILALVQGTFPLAGAARGTAGFINLARPVAQGQFVFVMITFVCLTYSFVYNDFSVTYVATNSNSALPLQYRIAGVWGGHEGSLLLPLTMGTWKPMTSFGLLLALWIAAGSAVSLSRRVGPVLSGHVWTKLATLPRSYYGTCYWRTSASRCSSPVSLW